MKSSSKPGLKNDNRIAGYEALARKGPGCPCYSRSEIEALAFSLIQTCDYCRDTFIARNPTRRSQYCSITCKNRAAPANRSREPASSGDTDSGRGRTQAFALIHACQHCGDPFLQINPGRVGKFCSNACVNAATRTLERRTIPCQGCGIPFETKQDHGRWPKFCTRDCLLEYCNRPIDRACDSCGSMFKAIAKSSCEGQVIYASYCSNQCRHEGQRKGKTIPCANCGLEFWASPSTENRNKSRENCCSNACRNAYRKRDRAPAWKGGLIAQNDRPYRRIDRTGYAAKYEGEHRLIVERVIGRKMIRGEVVICLDRDHANLAESNLFLCSGQKEFGFLKNGVLPWPERSNLEDCKAGEYQCPEIEVIVHEWLDGKRRAPGSKRYITRHPQADEIIARRKAGASLRDLATAFGNSNSTMRETLERRL